MAISQWALAERPRERLLANGAGVLTDAELVAVLLRTGVRGKSAVEQLARELLVKYDDIEAAERRAGARSGQGSGAREDRTARRRDGACPPFRGRRIREAKALTSPGAVRDYLRLAIGGRPHEVFICIWLDAQHRVIQLDEPFRGTLTQTSVYPPRGRKNGFADERGGGHFCPQSSFEAWRSPTRPTSCDPQPEGCAGADRGEGARSLHHRGQPGHLFRRAGIVVVKSAGFCVFPPTRSPRCPASARSPAKSR